MPHHSDPPPRQGTSWPEVKEAYIDEFGPIDPGVYQFAAKVWPIAKSPSFQNLVDCERLLIKAVAIVSRVCAEQPDKMTNIRAYLYKTFARLLLEELRIEERHEQLDTELLDHVAALTTRSGDDVEQMILLHEIMDRADNWTREIFGYLVQGYSIEELAQKYNSKANVMRSKLSKNMNRLRKQIEKETRAAEQRIVQRGQVASASKGFKNR